MIDDFNILKGIVKYAKYMLLDKSTEDEPEHITQAAGVLATQLKELSKNFNTKSLNKIVNEIESLNDNKKYIDKFNDIVNDLLNVYKNGKVYEKEIGDFKRTSYELNELVSTFEKSINKVEINSFNGDKDSKIHFENSMNLVKNYIDSATHLTRADASIEELQLAFDFTKRLYDQVNKIQKDTNNFLPAGVVDSAKQLGNKYNRSTMGQLNKKPQKQTDIVKDVQDKIQDENKQQSNSDLLRELVKKGKDIQKLYDPAKTYTTEELSKIKKELDDWRKEVEYYADMGVKLNNNKLWQKNLTLQQKLGDDLSERRRKEEEEQEKAQRIDDTAVDLNDKNGVDEITEKIRQLSSRAERLVQGYNSKIRYSLLQMRMFRDALDQWVLDSNDLQTQLPEDYENSDPAFDLWGKNADKLQNTYDNLLEKLEAAEDTQEQVVQKTKIDMDKISVNESNSIGDTNNMGTLDEAIKGLKQYDMDAKNGLRSKFGFLKRTKTPVSDDLQERLKKLYLLVGMYKDELPEAYKNRYDQFMKDMRGLSNANLIDFNNTSSNPVNEFTSDNAVELKNKIIQLIKNIEPALKNIQDMGLGAFQHNYNIDISEDEYRKIVKDIDENVIVGGESGITEEEKAKMRLEQVSNAREEAASRIYDWFKVRLENFLYQLNKLQSETEQISQETGEDFQKDMAETINKLNRLARTYIKNYNDKVEEYNAGAESFDVHLFKPILEGIYQIEDILPEKHKLRLDAYNTQIFGATMVDEKRIKIEKLIDDLHKTQAGLSYWDYLSVLDNAPRNYVPPDQSVLDNFRNNQQKYAKGTKYPVKDENGVQKTIGRWRRSKGAWFNSKIEAEWVPLGDREVPQVNSPQEGYMLYMTGLGTRPFDSFGYGLRPGAFFNRRKTYDVFDKTETREKIKREKEESRKNNQVNLWENYFSGDVGGNYKEYFDSIMGLDNNILSGYHSPLAQLLGYQNSLFDDKKYQFDLSKGKTKRPNQTMLPNAMVGESGILGGSQRLLSFLLSADKDGKYQEYFKRLLLGYKTVDGKEEQLDITDVRDAVFNLIEGIINIASGKKISQPLSRSQSKYDQYFGSGKSPYHWDTTSYQYGKILGGKSFVNEFDDLTKKIFDEFSPNDKKSPRGARFVPNKSRLFWDVVDDVSTHKISIKSFSDSQQETFYRLFAPLFGRRGISSDAKVKSLDDINAEVAQKQNSPYNFVDPHILVDDEDGAGDFDTGGGADLGGGTNSGDRSGEAHISVDANQIQYQIVDQIKDAFQNTNIFDNAFENLFKGVGDSVDKIKESFENLNKTVSEFSKVIAEPVEEVSKKQKEQAKSVNPYSGLGEIAQRLAETQDLKQRLLNPEKSPIYPVYKEDAFGNRTMHAYNLEKITPEKFNELFAYDTSILSGSFNPIDFINNMDENSKLFALHQQFQNVDFPKSSVNNLARVTDQDLPTIFDAAVMQRMGLQDQTDLNVAYREEAKNLTGTPEDDSVFNKGFEPFAQYFAQYGYEDTPIDRINHPDQEDLLKYRVDKTLSQLYDEGEYNLDKLGKYGITEDKWDAASFVQRRQTLDFIDKQERKGNKKEIEQLTNILETISKPLIDISKSIGDLVSQVGDGATQAMGQAGGISLNPFNAEGMLQNAGISEGLISTAGGGMSAIGGTFSSIGGSMSGMADKFGKLNEMGIGGGQLGKAVPAMQVVGEVMKVIGAGIQLITQTIMQGFKIATAVLKSVLKVVTKILNTSPIFETIKNILNLAFTMIFLPAMTLLGDQLMPTILKLLDWAVSYGQEFTEIFQPFIDDLVNSFTTVFDTLITFFSEHQEDIAKFLQGAIELLPGLLDVGLKAMGLFVDHKDDIIGLCEKTIDAFDKFLTKEVFDKIFKFAEGAIEIISEYGPTLLDAILTISLAVEAIAKVVAGFTKPLKQLVNLKDQETPGEQLVQQNQLHRYTNPVTGIANTIIDGLSQGLSNLLGFADGGYVPATPGGVPAIIGEGGEGEYIIPESKLGNIGGGVTIVFSGNVYGMNDFKSQVKSIMNEYNTRSSYR